MTPTMVNDIIKYMGEEQIKLRAKYMSEYYNNRTAEEKARDENDPQGEFLHCSIYVMKKIKEQKNG